MAQALNKPVFSTDALTLLEAGAPCEKNIKIVGAIDALRNEIFVKNDRRQIVIKPIDEFCKTLKKYKSNLRIVGGAVNSYRQIMEKSLGKKALSLDEHFHLLKADVLATFAYKKLKPKKYFEISPVYIRKSWAEEKAQ
jgi:tRNA A37 threonylcarbamoyladenosine modification protein TsaB